MESPAPITHLDKKPCGCILTEYADGRKIYAPCVACGLMRTAYELEQAGSVRLPWRRRRHLMAAGNALAAVATAIARQTNKQHATVEVLDKALKDQQE